MYVTAVYVHWFWVSSKIDKKGEFATVSLPGKTRLDGGRPIRRFGNDVEPKIIFGFFFFPWAIFDQLVLGRPLLAAFPFWGGSQSDPGSLASGSRVFSWVLGPNWKPSWLIPHTLSGALEILDSSDFLKVAGKMFWFWKAHRPEFLHSQHFFDYTFKMVGTNT